MIFGILDTCSYSRLLRALRTLFATCKSPAGDSLVVLLLQAVELLAQGADPTQKDKQGLTAAHYAASNGYLDVLQYLATKGVDLDAEDPKGRTTLHYAALTNQV